MEPKQPVTDFDYKIAETNDDPFQQTIEKSGIKTRFKLQDIKDHRAYLEKQLNNLNTKKMAHEAQIILLTNRHPEYADIHENDLMTCMAYCSKKLQNKELEEEIKVTEDLIKEYDEEMNHMLSLFDIHVVDPKELETKPEQTNG